MKNYTSDQKLHAKKKNQTKKRRTVVVNSDSGSD